MSNERSKAESINTFGPSFFTVMDETNKRMNLEFVSTFVDKDGNKRYGDFLAIKMSQQLSEADAKSKGMSFESTAEAFLVPKKAKALSKLVKKCIEGGEAAFTKAITSGSSLIEVSNTGRFQSQPGILTITIFYGLDENKKPAGYDVFQFSPSDNDVIISDFNMGDDGANYIVDFDNADVDIFYDALNEFATKSTGASSHFVRKGQYFTIKASARRQIQVMEKLGIDTSTPGYVGGGKKSTPKWNAKKESDNGESVASIIDGL